ncbi:acetolactate decarboxylase [Methanoplanus sp. FWC-SCC4]|uniref:Alpha-acetolactate decarboxylase n=1 Tax=Methanochimaera problematica TaxID=2609417 RepID=A0AA97I4D6_9EURY|nr:acetolactate decarboxylase [Methanoplanus sp. FWC-SCC4]WOF16231.1 acetolactate decarboxylase [Methanoplanus sp. FWC-SCC4]
MQKQYLLGFGAAVAVIFFVSAVITFNPSGVPDEDRICQVSTLENLIEGNYNGTVSYGAIMNMGDTGLGTFDHLDGEMVAAGGEYFQIKSDGSVTLVDSKETSPFAEVTRFNPDSVFEIRDSMNFSEIKNLMQENLTLNNRICTIRIDGKYSEVKARSVARQEMPYVPLSEALSMSENIFEAKEITGTATGFWHPDYMSGLNAQGFHLHFIDEKREFGGHIIDFTFETGFISLDYSDEFLLIMPEENKIYNNN